MRTLTSVLVLIVLASLGCAVAAAEKKASPPPRKDSAIFVLQLKWIPNTDTYQLLKTNTTQGRLQRLRKLEHYTAKHHWVVRLIHAGKTVFEKPLTAKPYITVPPPPPNEKPDQTPPRVIPQEQVLQIRTPFVKGAKVELYVRASDAPPTVPKSELLKYYRKVWEYEIPSK